MPACSEPPNRPPRDIVDRLIADFAWAKTCMIIAAATKPSSPEREREMEKLRKAVVEPRRAANEIFSKGQSLPRALLIELRSCEMAIPKLEAGAVLPVNAQTRDLYTTSPADLKKACRALARQSPRASKHDVHWRAHPDKIRYLLNWYPHWGAEPLAKELNIPIKAVKQKARTLNLKMLRPRETRICYHCRVNFIGKHKKFGLRCTECFNPYRADKRRAAIHKNPLRERLRGLAYQLNSRNRRARNSGRKGIQDNISVEMLLQIWDRQKGRCAYTGREMLASDADGGRRGPDTLSVDRVDSRQRYFRNNIVLCTWWANVAKHELDVSDFVERCREVVQRADCIKTR